LERSKRDKLLWKADHTCFGHSHFVDRIILDPAILVGKPIVRGTRLSVDFLLGLLAGGWPETEVLRNYPGLSREDLLACIDYARERVRDEPA
jgi:uncharacterized protein (DUF433 family)